MRPGTEPNLTRRLSGNQQVRFIVIGGINTLLSTGLFVAFQLWFGARVYSFVPLGLAWIISVVVVFFPHRRLVFRVRGHPLLDFGRFVLVNAGTFGINVGALFLASDVFGGPRVPSQLVITGIMVGFSFLGHKHVSFRRPDDPAASSGPSPDPAREQQ